MRAICSFKVKGQHHQHGQQSSLFVTLLAAATSIPSPISLEWAHSYFEVLHNVVTILNEILKSEVTSILFSG
jgi:hypothetical protein